MKSKTDVMGVVRFICNFYHNYREHLGMSHEEARKKTEETYNNIFYWVYEDELEEEQE